MTVPGADHAEWRARAKRLAPLIDGIDYYRYLRDAFIQAQHQILIVGWDLHTEIDLLRGADAEQARRESDWPVRLADLLLRLVHERETLQIRLLIWRGASLFALERQHWPRIKRPWADHPRLLLRWDADTPRIGAQHQKFIVIDDAVAFTGGMDLTSSRWDTHDHVPNEARRRLPGLLPLHGDPYHDLMLVLDGDAARMLGDWARERWKRVTGEALDTPPDVRRNGNDCWPDELEPLWRDRDVYVALTQPRLREQREKRQVEQTFLAQIAAAKRFILIETQYLTTAKIVDALCERLRDIDGPEVILILPPGCPGGIQAMSMDPHRDTLLDRLREADADDRFGVYWATLAGGSTKKVFKYSVYIHAKTMVIDDRLVRIGSANLNNRSMGLDTELDVFFAVDDGDEDGIAAIARYRRRLLSYLLHTDADAIADAERERGSILAAIESLRGGEQTLHPFEHRAEALDTDVALPIELADPDHPLTDEDAERVLDALWAGKGVAQHVRESFADTIAVVRHRRRWLGAMVFVLACAGLWTLTPAHGLVDQDDMRALLRVVGESPAGLAVAAVVFIGLASAGIPVSFVVLLLLVTVGLVWGLPICAAGVLICAAIHYALGKSLPSLRTRLNTLEAIPDLTERLRGQSTISLALVRATPSTPFHVVNAACGAVGVSLPRYFVGSAIGMLPSFAVLVGLGWVLRRLLIEPSPGLLAILYMTALGGAAVIFLSDLWLRSLDERGFKALEAFTDEEG